MNAWLPYLWGALGGLGILLAYYGYRAVADARAPPGPRRRGLWLLNLGIVLLAASMALSIWLK
jgi:hypothetical protein